MSEAGKDPFVEKRPVSESNRLKAEENARRDEGERQHFAQKTAAETEKQREIAANNSVGAAENARRERELSIGRDVIKSAKEERDRQRLAERNVIKPVNRFGRSKEFVPDPLPKINLPGKP